MIRNSSKSPWRGRTEIEKNNNNEKERWQLNETCPLTLNRYAYIFVIIACYKNIVFAGSLLLLLQPFTSTTFHGYHYHFLIIIIITRIVRLVTRPPSPSLLPQTHDHQLYHLSSPPRLEIQRENAWAYLWQDYMSEEGRKMEMESGEKPKEWWMMQFHAGKEDCGPEGMNQGSSYPLIGKARKTHVRQEV